MIALTVSALLASGFVGACVGGCLEFLGSRLSAPGPLGIRGVTIRLRPRGASAGVLVGAVLPLAAWVFTATPAAAVVATAVGWLLLGIAICDERSLLIPHALWIGGIIAGLALGMWAGGWHAAAARAATALVLVVGLRGAGSAAGRIRARVPVGPADYGVIGFVGALCGGTVAIDVVLVAGIVALAYLSPQPPTKAARFLHACFTVAGAALTAFGGVGGAAVTALALVLLRRPSPREASTPDAAAPFGACLALAVVMVVLGGAVPVLHDVSALRADVVLHHLILESR